MLNHRIRCIYTIIYKYGKHTRLLIFKMELRETMTAGENRFAPKLNEKEVIGLLEDLTNTLAAFLIKQLFHLRVLDMR